MSQKYSVLMSVYAKEKPEYLVVSLDSMLAQTMAPDEIMIIEDGPLPEALEDVVQHYKSLYPKIIVVHRLERNVGLGNALAVGVPLCRNEIIARMDSDDYSLPVRMEMQLKRLNRDHLDLVGSQVSEFEGDVHIALTHSTLPLSAKDIAAYSRKRNPFRHPTVVFKKSVILEVGNYSNEYPYFEDWDLFNRVIDNGYNVENVDMELVKMRVNSNFYNRRGGLSYAGYIWKFKVAQFKKKHMNLFEFGYSTFPHLLISLMPGKARSFVYKNILRRSENAHE